MNEDETPPQETGRSAAGGDLRELIADAQHDLRNPLGNILGFCEILLKQVQSSNEEHWKPRLQSIYDLANQMIVRIDRVLDPDKTPAGPGEVSTLQVQLRPEASQIITTLETLAQEARRLPQDHYSEDLTRMSESAERVARLIETALSIYPAHYEPKPPA